MNTKLFVQWSQDRSLVLYTDPHKGFACKDPHEYDYLFFCKHIHNIKPDPFELQKQ